MNKILIIGGGIIGLSLARELQKRGAGKITILESGTVGQESSFAAAGMLLPQAETDIYDEYFRFRFEANKIYPQFAEEIFDETGVDINFDKTGTICLAFTEKDCEEFHLRFAKQRELGLPVERLSAETVRKNEPFVSPDVREGLFFPDDGQVENRKILQALRKFAELHGIEIRENCEVKNLLSANGKIVGAEMSEEKFSADTVVLATGAWTNFVKLDGGELICPKISPVRGQILAFRTVKQFFKHVITSRNGYIVPRLDGRILVGATVEYGGFEKNTTETGTESLLECAREISPSLANLQITENIVGLRPFASDGLPVFGNFPNADNLFVATAHYRNGILLAPLTAKMFADKILLDSESDYFKLFSPQRFRSATAF